MSHGSVKINFEVAFTPSAEVANSFYISAHIESNSNEYNSNGKETNEM